MSDDRRVDERSGSVDAPPENAIADNLRVGFYGGNKLFNSAASMRWRDFDNLRAEGNFVLPASPGIDLERLEELIYEIDLES